MMIRGAVAALALASAASGQSPRVRYQADAHIDVAAGTIEVAATLHLPVQAAVRDTIQLLLNRGLTIHELSGEDVRSHRAAPFELVPSWNRITIELNEPLAPGSIRTLRIRYGGRLDLPPNGSNGVLPGRVELGLDSQWFPTPARLDHELEGELRLSLPQGWQVVASGGTVRSDGNDQVIRTVVPQIDVAFFATTALRQVKGKRFTVFYNRAADHTVAATLDAVESCVAYLDARFGSRNPFPGGQVVIADRPGTGYARKNYIVLSDAGLDSTRSLHNFACHEISHYWTSLTAAMTADYWLSETMAEYAAAMYLREKDSQAAFDRRRAIWEEGGRSAGPVWTPAMTERQSSQVAYRRGPLLLAQLEERIGPEQFGRFIDGYLVQGIHTTAPLLDHLAAVAGEESAAWFRAELARDPRS